MATKEQERAALAKIRKIVADLGENSYLGTAFDGAFELAEQNIDDDAAYSAKYYYDRCLELESRRTKGCTYEERVALESELTTWKQDHARLQNRAEYLQSKVEELESGYKTLAERNVTLGETIDSMKATANQRDTEILTLKAKLYDWMTS